MSVEKSSNINTVAKSSSRKGVISPRAHGVSQKDFDKQMVAMKANFEKMLRDYVDKVNKDTKIASEQFTVLHK